jgi:hypothetical protein
MKGRQHDKQLGDSITIDDNDTINIETRGKRSSSPPHLLRVTPPDLLPASGLRRGSSHEFPATSISSIAVTVAGVNHDPIMPGESPLRCVIFAKGQTSNDPDGSLTIEDTGYSVKVTASCDFRDRPGGDMSYISFDLGLIQSAVVFQDETPNPFPGNGLAQDGGPVRVTINLQFLPPVPAPRAARRARGSSRG